eukprot:TRINITY_DN81866_c0_g1_i1.p1 TRINITY_DN81866_c0_g1~~TRINITY_DN81866_c0_g1_i1.p1  ORF type:complete len:689 (-),score=117.53 TRINITY_DN81866_c0_g1_i1:41-2107(-)
MAASAPAQMLAVLQQHRPGLSMELRTAGAGALVLAALNAASGRCRRLTVWAALIVPMQLTMPLAWVKIAWIARQLWKMPRLKALKVAMRTGLTVWALLEAAFFVYILACWRLLENASLRRWKAVPWHATSERRLASMTRYCEAFSQIFRGGAKDSDLASNGAVKRCTSERVSHSRRRGSMPIDPVAAAAAVAAAQKGAGGLRRMFSGGADGGGLSEFGRKLSWGSAPKRAESIDDMLRTWDSERPTGGDKGAAPGGIGYEADATELAEGYRQLKWIELATWFNRAGDTSDPRTYLRRGNVEEFIAHWFFRGSTLKQLSGEERQELSQLTDLYLAHNEIEDLADGVEPTARCIKVSDPLLVEHRPLLVYASSSFIFPCITNIVMRALGFKRETIGGLMYWHRPPRSDIPSSSNIAGDKQPPAIFVHGLGLGLVPYYAFLGRFSESWSGDIFVPEFSFLAMVPYEAMPSAREVVAQLQDMLLVHGHRSAHFMGHSYGSVIVCWVIKMSPTSVTGVTLLEPATFLCWRSEMYNRVILSKPNSIYEQLLRYFVFRELFTINLLQRNTWEQNILWPEEIRVPCVVQFAAEDFVVHSHSIRRLLESEKALRLKRQQTSMLSGKIKRFAAGSAVDLQASAVQDAVQEARLAAPLEILWMDNFFHGQILGSSRGTQKLFSKMRRTMCGSSSKNRSS